MSFLAHLILSYGFHIYTFFDILLQAKVKRISIVILNQLKVYSTEGRFLSVMPSACRMVFRFQFERK